MQPRHASGRGLTVHQVRQIQAKKALEIVATRFPELEILLWEANAQTIFVEYRRKDGSEIARAFFNYEGNLIQRL